ASPPALLADRALPGSAITPPPRPSAAYRPPSFTHHFSRVDDLAGEGAGGDRGGRAHEDARLGAAHAALEVARARGEAGLAGGEDADVDARAGAAGRGRHQRAGLHQRLHVAQLE